MGLTVDAKILEDGDKVGHETLDLSKTLLLIGGHGSIAVETANLVVIGQLGGVADATQAGDYLARSDVRLVQSTLEVTGRTGGANSTRHGELQGGFAPDGPGGELPVGGIAVGVLLGDRIGDGNEPAAPPVVPLIDRSERNELKGQDQTADQTIETVLVELVPANAVDGADLGEITQMRRRPPLDVGKGVGERRRNQIALHKWVGGNTFEYEFDLDMPVNPHYVAKPAAKPKAKHSRKTSAKPEPSPAPAKPENTKPPKASTPKRARLTPFDRKERKRTLAAQRRQNRKKQGLCIDCPNKAVEGQTRCSDCAEKHRSRR